MGLLMLCTLVYYGLWATDMYISEARFSLRSPEGNGSVEWLALFGKGGSTTADSHVMQQYIESPALFEALEAEQGLKGHYRNPKADFFSRLAEEPTREEFVEYMRQHVSVHFDQASGIMTLKVRAFTPTYARQLCQAILERSEALVNRLRERGVEDSLALSRQEVDHAEQRLTEARQQMRLFREKHNLLDPLAQAGAVQGLVAQLEGAAAQVRAELAEARSFMREDSARIEGLKARQEALEQQIVREKLRLTGKNDDAINTVGAKYEELSVEHEFAQKQYMAALASLEAARIRAESQSRYLVAFLPPTLPQEALWPRRTYAIGIGFLTILLTFSLGSLIVAAVREHAGV